MGGTEIYQPLSWVLKLPRIEGYLRQIFILTDGEVCVRQNSASNHGIYSLCVGVERRSSDFSHTSRERPFASVCFG